MKWGWSVIAALVLCLTAAGCGGGGKHAATTPPTHPCPLSARQKRAIATTLSDIHRLHRLEAPLSTFSEDGTPAMQTVTGKVLTDIGRVELPVDTRARLLRLAKAASGLCGSCFGAFESMEPAVVTRVGGHACTGR